jgi:light-regulated signal transduction histidine kinase (bacteriophytochrome)
MGQLVDDLLAFSRISRNELVKVNIPMHTMVTNFCNELKKEQAGRIIEFRIGHLFPALADNIAIKQVWLNLISNAIKYSRHKEKTIIEIGSEIKGDEIVYHIKDNGAGFDMRYVDKLFGVFQRLHSEEEFEGTGVGLAFVHRIIFKHGGRVWGEGKVNEGATFYFTLNKS